MKLSDRQYTSTNHKAAQVSVKVKNFIVTILVLKKFTQSHIMVITNNETFTYNYLSTMFIFQSRIIYGQLLRNMTNLQRRLWSVNATVHAFYQLQCRTFSASFAVLWITSLPFVKNCKWSPFKKKMDIARWAYCPCINQP